MALAKVAEGSGLQKNKQNVARFVAGRFSLLTGVVDMLQISPGRLVVSMSRDELIAWVNIHVPEGQGRFNALQELNAQSRETLFTENSFALLLFFAGVLFTDIEDSWLDLWSVD